MSENPAGGLRSERPLTAPMLATAYTTCVSGSAPAPGQFVPPLALPTLIAPRMPFGSPTTGIRAEHEERRLDVLHRRRPRQARDGSVERGEHRRRRDCRRGVVSGA